MGKLFEELKRRKVFRVAAVYAVVAWVLIQVADVVLPTFGAPEWVNQTIIFLFILGFFPTLIASWAYDITPQGIKADTGSPAPVNTTSSSDRKLIYATFGLVLVVAGLQLSDRFLIQPLVEPEISDPVDQNNAVTRLSVRVPEDEFFDPVRGDFDISNDGTLFVYRGSDENNVSSQLWVRRFDELSGRRLRDTTGATRPQISPDGEEVVFQTRGSIRVVPTNGGLSRTLASGGTDTPSWSPDGEWVYFRDAERGISRVRSEGGEPEKVRRLNEDNGDVDYQNTKVLPGGESIVYSVARSDYTNVIRAENLTTGLVRDLATGQNPIYSDTGHLLFQPDGEATLLAAPFNTETLEFTGSPLPIASGLLLVGSGQFGNVGLSANGRLVYRTGGSAGFPGKPMWVARDGSATEIDPDWTVRADLYSALLSLSPQGDRLAITLMDSVGAADLWVKRLDNGPLSRITFGGSDGYHPSWSPDDNSLVYTTVLPNVKADLYSKNADGSGVAQLLLEKPSGRFIEEPIYSPDGRWLVYRERGVGFFSGDLYALELGTNSDPISLVENEFFNQSPAISSDSKWLAYVSDESGQREVYVRPFPETDSGRWQVSNNGGSEPVWANSGQELFYRNSTGDLVAVQLTPGDVFEWDSQQVLFSATGYRSSIVHVSYDVAPDDQRFVMTRMQVPEDTELIVVDNWFKELE